MNKDMPDNIWARFDPPAAIEADFNEYDGFTEYLRRTVSREEAREMLSDWDKLTNQDWFMKHYSKVRKLLEQAGK